MRQAMNAIFYLLKSGSPWRYLPRHGFPPRSTEYNIFRKFQADGTWEAIWAELYILLREREGREASPTAAVMDSQTGNDDVWAEIEGHLAKNDICAAAALLRHYWRLRLATPPPPG